MLTDPDCIAGIATKADEDTKEKNKARCCEGEAMNLPAYMESRIPAKVPRDGRTLTFCLQKRKCGKRYCGTCKRQGGHGPYFFCYYKDDEGRMRSAYIGKP